MVEDLALRYEGRALIAKVDVDGEPELARRFGVMNIPTVVFLKEGREFGPFPPRFMWKPWTRRCEKRREKSARNQFGSGRSLLV